METCKLVSRTLARSNTRFNVYFDHITDSNGDEIKDYLVVSPKIKGADQVSGVAILPVLEGKIGLLHLYRHAVEAFVWELPRGFIEAGEEHSQSAIRELAEETGLACAPENLSRVAAIFPEAGIVAGKILVFIAKHCRQDSTFVPQEMGHRELKFFTMSEIEIMISTEQIQDPCTLVALFRLSAL